MVGAVAIESGNRFGLTNPIDSDRHLTTIGPNKSYSRKMDPRKRMVSLLPGCDASQIVPIRLLNDLAKLRVGWQLFPITFKHLTTNRNHLRLLPMIAH